MTNFDPGGFITLFTVLPSVVAGVVSIGVAHLASRLGYGDYERNVAAIVAVLLVGWAGTALLVSTSLLLILAVTLSMVGAFAVTRSVRATSYGWVLGVVLLFVAFAVLSALGVYRGVDQTGVPQGPFSRHVEGFYFGGLLVFGAIGGAVVRCSSSDRGWRHRCTIGPGRVEVGFPGRTPGPPVATLALPSMHCSRQFPGTSPGPGSRPRVR